MGSILTNAAQEIILLSLHRLARMQVTYFASPATTGIRNMDCYISGTLTEVSESRSHYSEELVTMEGTGFCFNYELLPQESRMQFSRQKLGISEEATVFASRANMSKVIPEVRESWAKILAAVSSKEVLKLADVYLDFYPFGGANSLVDPLEVGVATVAMEGRNLRSRPKFLDSRAYSAPMSAIFEASIERGFRLRSS